MKLRIIAEISPSVMYAVFLCSREKSITVAERTWCCQLSMKYTRKGTKETASKACETDPKPRVSRSSQLVPGRGSAGFVGPSGSVSPSDSARSRTCEISCRMVRVYLERSCTKIRAWFEE